MAQGALPSAGTRDTRVDRPDEGLPGIATVENPTANPPSRATLDAGKPTRGSVVGTTSVIDTTGTGGITQDQALKRAKPAVWA